MASSDRDCNLPRDPRLNETPSPAFSRACTQWLLRAPESVPCSVIPLPPVLNPGAPYENENGWRGGG
jgi:hypothetical protein